MAKLIPEGFGFAARAEGQTRREAARYWLAKAEKAGLDPQQAVFVTQGGYHVDERLLEDGGASADADGNDEGKAPAESASKGDWVDFAKTQGYDESEGLTKAELIERYGVTE